MSKLCRSSSAKCGQIRLASRLRRRFPEMVVWLLLCVSRASNSSFALAERSLISRSWRRTRLHADARTRGHPLSMSLALCNCVTLNDICTSVTNAKASQAGARKRRASAKRLTSMQRIMTIGLCGWYVHRSKSCRSEKKPAQRDRSGSRRLSGRCPVRISTSCNIFCLFSTALSSFSR